MRFYESFFFHVEITSILNRIFDCLSSNDNVFSGRDNISDGILLNDSPRSCLAVLDVACSLLTKENRMTNKTILHMILQSIANKLIPGY